MASRNIGGVALALSLVLVAPARAAGPAAPVYRVVIDGPINAIEAEYVERALGRAESEGSQLVLLELDTPGGLADAMEDIIRRMLSSRVPICAYVYPPGGRAASAGFFLLISADLAAMAPGTRAGAAHPILAIGGFIPVGDEGGGKEPAEAPDGGAAGDAAGPVPRASGGGANSTLMEKVAQDAEAYLRSIAVRRGRDAAAAELAVTESKSYSDQEALDRHLIDLVAGSERELLAKLDGREVHLLDGTARTLATREAPIVEVDKTFRERALDLLTDANIAFLMLLCGALLIYIEVTHTGMVVPGVIGGILLLLAVMGFSFLPINVTGVLLLLAGAGLLAAEVFIGSFGFLGVGGVACLAIGSIILVDVSDASLRIDPYLAVGAAATAGAIVVFLGMLALRAHRRPRATGMDALVGEEGEVVVDLAPRGKVLLHGEFWHAVASAPLPRGTRVRCVKAAGMLLEVEAAGGGGAAAPVPGDAPDEPAAREEESDAR